MWILAGMAVGIAAGNAVAFIAYREMRETPSLAPGPEATPPPPEVARTVPAESREKAMALRNQGLSALKDGDYDRASRRFIEALAIDSEESDIPSLLELANKLKRHNQEAPAAQREVSPPETETLDADDKRPSHASVRRDRGRARKAAHRDTPAPALETEPSLLLVTTTPSRLTIRVDGEVRDMSPSRIEVDAGAHKVEIMSGNRVLLEKTVQAGPGEVVTFAGMSVPCW